MSHRKNADAYFLKANRADVPSLLEDKQMSIHREQVRKKREVMERVVEIMRVIGKRGLSYRADRNEAAYGLKEKAVDDGNFLELILLLKKYDVPLKEHLDDCIQNSEHQHETGGRGRGALLTLLSKTTVNKIIEIICGLIQQLIAGEVSKAGMFSIQLDTTQDITFYLSFLLFAAPLRLHHLITICQHGV